MMTIYNENINVMKTCPYLYNFFLTIENTGKCYIKVQAINTLEEVMALKISDKDKDYRLNSSYYPTKEAQIWASQYEYKDICNYVVMYGLGNGVFAKELVNKLRKDDMMFIYEPSIDIFKYILRNFDIRDILEKDNVFLIVEGINEQYFQSVIKENLDWTMVAFSSLCVHPRYDELFQLSYSKYLKDLKYAISSININRNTQEKIGKNVAANSIRNIKYYKEAFVDLDLKSVIDENIPAIIVAAGPSLSKNIEELRRAKGKAVIIVVDRALKLLLDKGIVPDFVITLDANKPAQYFHDKPVRVPMFCTTYAGTEIMSAHKGKKIFYGAKGFNHNLMCKLGKKASELNVGGSVATGAFSVCMSLGLKNIILVGQDLAFDSKKSTHAEGLHGDGEHLKEVYARVEGLYGDLVDTRYDWYIYLNWFQESICSITGINVIDATEGGAKIAGTQIMTLKEVVNSYCIEKVDIDKVLDDLEPIVNCKNIIEFKNEIIQTINDINELILEAQQALQLCNMFIKRARNNRFDGKQMNNMAAKLSVINKSIKDYPVYAILDYEISNTSVDYLSDIYKLSGNEKQDQITTYKKAAIIYKALIDSAKRVKPMFDELLEYYHLD